MKPDNDTRHNPHDLPPPRHNGHAIVDGEVSENPVDVVAARYNLTTKQAEEIFQYFDETMNSGDQMNTASVSQAVGEAVRERDRQWILWLGKIFSVLDVYTYKQRDLPYVRMSITTMMFVLGYKVESGVNTFADIARKHLKLIRRQSGKQTVCKCAAHFLEQIKLAPMLTQRTAAARQEMADARNEQITGKTNE